VKTDKENNDFAAKTFYTRHNGAFFVALQAVFT